MTDISNLKEVLQLSKNWEAYISFESSESVCLDGYFTKEQLQMIINLISNEDYKDQLINLTL